LFIVVILLFSKYSSSWASHARPALGLFVSYKEGTVIGGQVQQAVTEIGFC